ncbi:tRNA lysidine(34) synthetase TilS [Mycobacterium sp. KBS0706]|uniref:tRNA lysidine(34) synthetase TilS n=1 Tax=Mycobacterium sp. KBS0706 TaxID=2578109 RepID=UPI00110FEB3E|nr:tRNA lysidine(34) synthetase TilS [Mycobacterium sp. KBS0706]TSD87782.1 tRNA lysidine(34) synthetase TilS [Mycobacterium sp. KBS0706]
MHDPVKDEEFAARLDRLGPFDRPLRLAVAVSGGPDSMALSLLAARWVRQRGGQILALTVDHRLRPDSTAEADAVGASLARHDIPHRILTWTDAPARASQDQARRARYDLLDLACRESGICDLLVAHHREDQAETVLLRLAKGSGIDGLAGMAAWRPAPWGRLLRPLLDLPKARLAATCAGFGVIPVDDPSNRRSRYARPRLRAAREVLAAEGLTDDRLFALARRAGQARAALERIAADLGRRAVWLAPAGYAAIDLTALQQAEPEITRRLLDSVTACIGGGGEARFDALERLADAVRAGALLGRTLDRTLGHCRLRAAADRLLVFRERRFLPEILGPAPGASLLWDGRFHIDIPTDAAPGDRIAAWGDAAKGTARRADLPFDAAAVLPALWRNGHVLRPPSLAGMAGDGLFLRFEPLRPLLSIGFPVV